MRSLTVLIVAAAIAAAAFGCSRNKAALQNMESQAKTSDEPTQTAERSVMVPSGMEMVAVLDQTLSTDKSHVGDEFSATVTNGVKVGGADVIPQGSTVRGHLTRADRAPRVGGKADLTLQFDEVRTPSGQSYAITARPLALEGKSTTKGDIEKLVGGAVGGAVVGGILGGKGGAEKGAAIGGATGAVVAVATRGQDIVLAKGTKVSVKLTAPVQISEANVPS